MLRTEMLARMSALTQRAEQFWTCHQVSPLDEMNSVAGNALENQTGSLLNEATADLQRGIKGKMTVVCNNISRVFDAIFLTRSGNPTCCE